MCSCGFNLADFCHSTEQQLRGIVPARLTYIVRSMSAGIARSCGGLVASWGAGGPVSWRQYWEHGLRLYKLELRPAARHDQGTALNIVYRTAGRPGRLGGINRRYCKLPGSRVRDDTRDGWRDCCLDPKSSQQSQHCILDFSRISPSREVSLLQQPAGPDQQ